MTATRTRPSTGTSRSADDRPQIAVIGGGIAGVHAAAALAAHPVGVTVIEPTGHHQFLTRLAAVAGGTQPRRDAAAPLDQLVPSATIVRNRVVGLDDAAGAVTIRMADDQVLDVDAAIVAAGAETARPSIPGLDRAFTLRSAPDALRIRDALGSASGLVVVGGGATGCQLAGAAAAADPDLDVTLVEASPQLLPGFRPVLGRRTSDILESRGVEVICNQAVERVRKTGVTLAEDGRHAEGIVVWAGGVIATGDGFGLGDTRNGRIVIDPTGRVVGSSRIFAAGDIAAHTDRRGELRPMSAQIAAQAGRTVGGNAARLLLDRSLETLDLTDLGWVVDLGGGRGVAEILGVPLADPVTERLVPTLHTVIDYRNLWQIGGLDAMRHHGPARSSAPDHRELREQLADFGLSL